MTRFENKYEKPEDDHREEPDIEEGNDIMYQQFIKEVASKVRDLEREYKRLAGKILAKLVDIF
jgi:hypothetical protein